MATTDKPITLEENYFRMLDEASQLGILPPQEQTLAYLGFHGIYRGDNVPDLCYLWRIYILLISIHHRPLQEILEWCQRKMFANYAAGILGRDGHEGRWLMERHSLLKPWCDTLWDQPSSIWYECAMICFDSAHDQQKNDPYIRARQKCYIAFGLFNLGGLPDPCCIRHDINIWHEFGLGTCKKVSDRGDLCRMYSKTIWKNSIRIHIPKSPVNVDFRYPQFDLFWKNYTSGNMVPWMTATTPPNWWQGKFFWLKNFLPKPAGSELLDASDWSIWRLCQLLESHNTNTAEIPEPFKAALRHYGIDVGKPEEQLVLAYQRIVKTGGLGELHRARQEGYLLHHAIRMSRTANPHFPLEDWIKTRFAMLDRQRKSTANPTSSTMNHGPNFASNPESERRGLSVQALLTGPESERGGVPLSDILNPANPTSSTMNHGPNFASNPESERRGLSVQALLTGPESERGIAPLSDILNPESNTQFRSRR